ncbi:MAG: hypothetical protein AAF333_09525, partial [Planctomycetota bacterium]
MNNDRYIIGIEGISRRQSFGLLTNSNGKILAIAHIPEPMALHTIDENIIRRRLISLLSQLAEKASLGREEMLAGSSLCVGMRGITTDTEERLFMPRLMSSIVGSRLSQLVCVGDAELVLISHLMSTTGSAVICGHGSIALSMLRGRRKKIGGWGPLLGDEGS